MNQFLKFQTNRSEISGAICDARKSITFSIKLTTFFLGNYATVNLKKFWEKCLGNINQLFKFQTKRSEISGAIYDERKSITLSTKLTILFSETKRQKILKKFWEKCLGTIKQRCKFPTHRSENSSLNFRQMVQKLAEQPTVKENPSHFL